MPDDVVATATQTLQPALPSKRDLILERALGLFADRGYNGVGVEELASAAGVAKPTLYHYFGSKQGVLEALLHEQFDPFLESLAGAATYEGDLQRALSRIIRTVFDFGTANPPLYWMVLGAELTARDDLATRILAERLDRERAVLIALFDRAALDQGAIRGKERLAAETLLAMMTIHLRLAAHGEITLDDTAILYLIRHLIYGIYS
ncbi:MAG: helix-turn-helix domain-containing protein [Thermomicrobiales bacterium]